MDLKPYLMEVACHTEVQLSSKVAIEAATEDVAVQLRGRRGRTGGRRLRGRLGRVRHVRQGGARRADELHFPFAAARTLRQDEVSP